MSKVTAPIFNATIKPPAIFGVDPILAVLVAAAGVLGAIVVMIMALVFQRQDLMTFAPIVLFLVIGIGGPMMWKASAGDPHFLTMKIAAMQFRRKGKNYRNFIGAIVAVLLLVSAGDAFANVYFRPPPVLEASDWITIAAGLTSASIALAFVFVPSLVALRTGDTETEWIGSCIEFDHIGQDRVTIRLKNGGFARVYEIGGLQFTTKVLDEQLAEMNRRRNFFNSFRDRPVMARVITRKYSVDRGEPASYPSETLQKIADEEKKHFSATFAKKFYIILSVEKGKDEKVSKKALGDACKSLNTYMSSYNPRPVKASAKGVCPLSSLLSELVNGNPNPLVATARSLSARIGRVGVEFDGNIGLIRSHDGVNEKFETILVAKEYGEEARGDLIRKIMELPAEMEFNIRLQAVPDIKSKALLKNQEKQSALLQWNPLKAEQFQSVYQLIDAREEVQFKTEMCVILKEKSKEALSDLVDEVMQIAGYDGMAMAPAGAASAALWFGRLPGYDRFFAPLYPISIDLAAYCSFSREPEGDSSSVWGQGAIRSFKTARGGNYSVQYHIDPDRDEPLGHYAVIAPSDSGKTTLMLHLMGGMLRHPNTKGFVFDSKKGAQFMIEAMGGQYFDLNHGKMDLNPLHCKDTTENREHLIRQIQMMSGAHDDKSLEIIARVVEQSLAIEDLEKRTFSNVYKTGFDQGSDVQLGMKKWVVDPDGVIGPYSRLANGTRDALTEQMETNFLLGWNSDQILKNPEMAAPVFEHILHNILNGCKEGQFGFNIFVDEAAALFQNDAFRSGVAELYREVRKQNGIVGVAFQEPSALAKTDVANAVFDNCSSYFLFPNTAANKSDYANFNLNDEQWAYIKGMSDLSTKIKRSVMLIKRDKSGSGDAEESVILDIDLKPIVGPMLKVYQSGNRAGNLMTKLQRAFGKDSTEWVNHL